MSETNFLLPFEKLHLSIFLCIRGVLEKLRALHWRAPGWSCDTSLEEVHAPGPGSDPYFVCAQEGDERQGLPGSWACSEWTRRECRARESQGTEASDVDKPGEGYCPAGDQSARS